MNLTVTLSLISSIVFLINAILLMKRKKNTGIGISVFIPLLFSVLLYEFIVLSNLLEHAGVTGFFDPLEDIAEIVFSFMFLFFVNNWRKDQAEKRFRELFKLAPMPLAEVTREGKIIQANEVLNQKFYEFYGITFDDIDSLGSLWERIYPDEEYRKQVTSSWITAVDHSYDTGTDVKSFEREITCSDGSKRALILSTSIVGEKILFSLVDITDRKQAETAVLKNFELLRATFNTTPDGILVVSDEMKITQANHQFYKMWGMPEDYRKIVDEKTLRDTVADQIEDADNFWPMIDRLYNSHNHDKFEIPFKDGRLFDCSTSPMLLHDQEVGRVWFFRDISSQKQAETERKKLQQELLQAQKLEAIGILAGGVAHDFNNMLGLMMGYAELTLEEMDSDHPIRENIEKILDAGQRSASLTRQLLIFARKQTAIPVEVNLNDAVETMLKMLRRLIGENIELVWQPTKMPCTIKIDPTQLDQILANLCVNAREAITDVGQITIRTDIVSYDDISCAQRLDCTPGDYARLTVMDNGSGMDKNIIQHVFEPFFTTKGLGKGTGLGLATIYGIVKQSQGFIDLDSELGEGTTFDIFLPSHSVKNVAATNQNAETLPLGQGETILMVEDDTALIRMNQMMIGRLGYNVLIATRPSEAIAIVEKNNTQIDLFLTDIIMPEMNGKELIKKLLAIRPGVKYLFMSGYTADVITNRGISEGGDNFIQKPFLQKDIAAKLREILDG